VLLSQYTCTADKPFWWMGQNPFGGDSNSVVGGGGGGGGNYQQHTPQGNNNQGFQGTNNGNNFQGAGGNNFQGAGNGFNVLPATQGLGNNANANNQGSCPAVNGVPPAEQCTGRLSNCWSVGQADVDCLNDALCCFDGCANVCQGAGPIQQPAQPPTPARNPAPGNNNQNNFGAGSNNFNNVAAVPVPAPIPAPAPKPARRPAPTRAPAPARPVQAPAPARPAQAPAPVNNFQGTNNNNRPAGNNNNRPAGNNNNQNAAQKPYVSCPAAMKCVQRQNCDFNGVMTDQVLNLTPELEMLRVPLIPCVNRQRNNNVDVCCRDPNYKDPWPNMQGGGGMKNMNQNNGNNNGQNNGNAGFQNNGNPGNNFQGSGSNNQGVNSAINPRKQNKKKGYGR